MLPAIRMTVRMTRRAALGLVRKPNAGTGPVLQSVHLPRSVFAWVVTVMSTSSLGFASTYTSYPDTVRVTQVSGGLGAFTDGFQFHWPCRNAREWPRSGSLFRSRFSEEIKRDLRNGLGSGRSIGER